MAKKDQLLNKNISGLIGLVLFKQFFQMKNLPTNCQYLYLIILTANVKKQRKCIRLLHPCFLKNQLLVVLVFLNVPQMGIEKTNAR